MPLKFHIVDVSASARVCSVIVYFCNVVVVVSSCLSASVLRDIKQQYSSTVQQYSTVVQYSSTVQQYSTVVQYSSTVQQYSTVVQYNSTVQ